MNARIGKIGLATVLGMAAALAACVNEGGNNGGGGGGACFCPAGIGVATIDVCGAIGSYAADPDGDCNLTRLSESLQGDQLSESLQVESDVAGTCHVVVTMLSGATVSTDVTFTATSTPCGSDPHACQAVVASPATTSLGSCAEAGAD